MLLEGLPEYVVEIPLLLALEFGVLATEVAEVLDLVADLDMLLRPDDLDIPEALELDLSDPVALVALLDAVALLLSEKLRVTPSPVILRPSSVLVLGIYILSPRQPQSLP